MNIFTLIIIPFIAGIIKGISKDTGNKFLYFFSIFLMVICFLLIIRD